MASTGPLLCIYTVPGTMGHLLVSLGDTVIYIINCNKGNFIADFSCYLELQERQQNNALGKGLCVPFVQLLFTLLLFLGILNSINRKYFRI